MILALRTSVDPWRQEEPSGRLVTIDNTMQCHNVHLLNLPWDAYQFPDGDHFDDESFEIFCKDLATVLSLQTCKHKSSADILILADSTIDWFGSDGKQQVESVVTTTTGRACTVDAICGSGFCARSEHNDHFRTRLSKHLRTSPTVPFLLFIGGWNDARDERFTSETIAESITSCIQLYRRFQSLTI